MTVTIFSRSTCAPCKTVKYLLSKRGVSYEERDIDDPKNQADFARYGVTGVPLLVIGEHVIHGANFGAINNALNA
jgi:glutaredoxin